MRITDTEKHLGVLLKGALARLGWGDLLPDSGYLDIPASENFGDYSSNVALRLGRVLKRAPQQIAQEVADEMRRGLGRGPLGGYLKEVKAEGAGFVNFYFANHYFQECLKEIVARGERFARSNLGQGRRVLIEFVSANPTGPLSVAHARQAAVGDVLANIFSFLGFKVKKEYYLNDEGNQINILGRSIALRARELSGEKVDFPEDHYQGDYIRDIARGVLERNLRVADLGAYGADQILAIIKKELEDFGVRFDTWYSQKALSRSGKIEKVLAFLKKKGLVYKQEGAWWLASTKFGDDKDRVVIKSDGSYTYLAPDIAYHREKYRRGFKQLINLWGPDHHGYIPRLKAAVHALGYDPASLNVIIVQLATIFRNGKPVQMSTRRGQYITLREVLDEVGLDAARFFFLMRRTSSHLDFDLDVAKKQTSENPVYYVQYAYARIAGVLRGAPARVRPAQVDFSLLKEKEEVSLMRRLSRFPHILRICLSTQDPYMLTVYLQETACDFHRFYDLHRVLGQEERLTQARLALLEGTKAVLGAALGLVGVARPEKM